MKKILFLTLLLTVVMPVLADDSIPEGYKLNNNEINGICYSLHSNDNTATVTYRYTPESAKVYMGPLGGYSGHVVIPETVDFNGTTYPVTGIGYLAFVGCSLESLTLPSTIRTIGESAFKKCSLSELRISSWADWCNLDMQLDFNQVTVLGLAERVFVGGVETSLEHIVIPEGVKKIGNWCFHRCKALKSITLPNSLVSIGNYAFSFCNELPSAVIPPNVVSIGSSAFEGCSALDEINIPDNVTELGDGAFQDCYGARTLAVGRGITDIPKSAFSGCSALKSWTFASPIKSIGAFAFSGWSMDSFDIPESVETIGHGAFSYCKNLSSMTLPENVINMGSDAFFSSGLKTIVLNDWISEIGNQTFSYCDNLESVTLGREPIYIESSAFYSSPNLKEVISMCSYPIEIDDRAFDQEQYRNVTLYVPYGTKNRYRRLGSWNKFQTIKELAIEPGNYFLTVKDANGGKLRIGLKTNEQYTLQIELEKGWQLHSMTYNGQDVKEQLTEDLQFTIPSLRSDGEINIVYEQLADNIAARIAADGLRVSGANGGVEVSGYAEGTLCQVCQLDGKLVFERVLDHDSTLIPLAAGHTYIVRVGGRSFKVYVG